MYTACEIRTRTPASEWPQTYIFDSTPAKIGLFRLHTCFGGEFDSVTVPYIPTFCKFAQ